MPTRGVSVEVSVATDVAAAPRRADLRRWAAAAAAEVGVSGVVSIRVMGEDEMRDLNARYRGRDKATNVLSFPAQSPPRGGPRLLGDLALCQPVVEREAAEQGKPLADHYAHLVVHGVLHLAGFDHEAAADAEVMEAREIAVLARLGVADPYRPPGGPDLAPRAAGCSG
jgi:probable rRNA maturation factor